MNEGLTNSRESITNKVLEKRDEEFFDKEVMGELLGYKVQIQVLEEIVDLTEYLLTAEEKDIIEEIEDEEEELHSSRG